MKSIARFATGSICMSICLGLLLTLLTAPKGQAAEPTVLKIWLRDDILQQRGNIYARPETWREIEAALDIKIQLGSFPRLGYQEKLLASMVAGMPPDIIHIDRSLMPGFIKEDALARIPATYSEAYLRRLAPHIASLADFGHGVMYGYPHQAFEMYGLTWNKKHFREAGLDPEKPPKTWDEFREYAKKLTVYDKQGHIIRVGYAIRHLGNPHGIVHKHLWAIWGAGADLVTDPMSLKGGKTAFNNERGKAALMLIYDMLYSDRSTSLDFPDPRKAFVMGLASMQISELDSIQRAAKYTPWLEWGASVPPVIKAGMKPASNLNTWFLCVPATSKQQELAWKVLDLLMNEENDYALARAQKVFPNMSVNLAREPFVSDLYFQQTIKPMLEYGRSYPNHIALSSIMEALGAAIQKVWHNETNVHEALTEAQKRSDRAIGRVK